MNNNHRPYIRKSTRECLDMNAELFQTDNEGNIRDPNNLEIILTEDNKVKGHVPGFENKGLIDFSNKAGMSQRELNNIANNAGIYQYEDEAENSSHKHEMQDENQIALSTANYCYLENPDYQKNTFINRPESQENGATWTITTKNADDTQIYEVGTFVPDTDNTKSGFDSMCKNLGVNNTWTGADDSKSEEIEQQSNSVNSDEKGMNDDESNKNDDEDYECEGIGM